MLSTPSRSLLTAIVAGQVATGCFLSGDYKVEERTVHATAPNPTEDIASSDDALPSGATSPWPGPSNAVPSDLSSADETSASTEATSSAAEASTSATSATTDAPDALTGESESTDGDTRGPGDSGATSDPCSSEECSPPCAQDEVLGPRGRCYWFNAGEGSWKDAETTCSSRGQGWVPVAIHDEDEDEFVSSHVDSGAQTWLGARYTRGAWRWLDDDTAFWNGPGKIGAIRGVFVKWGTNEPSGAPNETCARIQSFNSQMRWGDNDCNNSRQIACQSPSPGD